MATVTEHGELLKDSDKSIQSSLPRSAHTFGHQSTGTEPSFSSHQSQNTQSSDGGALPVPIVEVNGRTSRAGPSKSSSPVNSVDPDESSSWGSNFWVTLVDPTSQEAFFACPATGDVSWDPPVNTFVLPPNPEGEWWELSDESRDGLPYYYQTKTCETVWERPGGFVIPLGIIQNTSAGRRFSQATFGPNSFAEQYKSKYRDSMMSQKELSSNKDNKANRNSSIGKSGQPQSILRRASLAPPITHMPTIPASPLVSDRSASSSPSKSPTSPVNTAANFSYAAASPSKSRDSLPKPDSGSHSGSNSRTRTPVAPQSLNAAAEKLSSSSLSVRANSPERANGSGLSSSDSGHGSPPRNKVQPSSYRDHSPSPRRPVPNTPGGAWRSTSTPSFKGKGIGAPIFNLEAAKQMNPVHAQSNGKPIPVTPSTSIVSQTHQILPRDLVSDIQQFSESAYARQYFSTHKTGFIFRRRVPVAQMMVWQKSALSSPLLNLHRNLKQDAVKIFKVIQRIMGDRERDRSTAGVRIQADTHVSTVTSINGGGVAAGGGGGGSSNVLEEERWLLMEGLAHGELRDEIYCQTMKQCTNNPNPESVFNGMQLFCVLLITFPPSKNFETYLSSFFQQRTSQSEGRVDVMAKHCLRRLSHISRKGPRGKAPTVAEIETASDAAFNPSTFGESLDATIRLQQRNYPTQKVPIILPFLADGILALGGLKAEGIFRIPGDGDSVSELKLRIDRGYYSLDGVDDPYVLASVLKLWLRELSDPLVPDEMYNECIENAKEPEMCINLVQRLPTINRRVVLFIVSFMQLFLEEKVQVVTKMTPANLALVMAPNLLRCHSESMAVVFTNASFEQIFVFNLLTNLKCNELDPEYQPAHGLGAVPSVQQEQAPRNSKSRSRRPN